MINKNDLRKAISSIAISNAKRNTIYKAFSDLGSITKEEFDSVKSDISKVVESMLTKDTVGKANGVASLDSNGSVPIEQLGNIDTNLFIIASELPTTDIKTNKIYLVPSEDYENDNVCTEYSYFEFEGEGFWEKLGEVKPEVNISEYVKSNEIYQCIKKEYDSFKRSTNSIAIDDSAVALGNTTIAIGNKAEAKGDKSIVIGTSASTHYYSSYSIVIGALASAKYDYAIVLGYNTRVSGSNAVTIGNNAENTAAYTIALGDEAKAKGGCSIALGYNAQANKGDSIALGAYANTSTVSKYALSGYDTLKQDIFNIEEITFSQYGNKKYLIGLGGYDGTNITINNEAGEEVLNPNIKSVQEIINSKADLVDGKLKAEQLPKLVNITNASTAEEVVTKFNALLADLKAKGYMEADTAQ